MRQAVGLLVAVILGGVLVGIWLLDVEDGVSIAVTVEPAGRRNPGIAVDDDGLWQALHRFPASGAVRNFVVGSCGHRTDLGPCAAEPANSVALGRDYAVRGLRRPSSQLATNQ